MWLLRYSCISGISLDLKKFCCEEYIFEKTKKHKWRWKTLLWRAGLYNKQIRKKNYLSPTVHHGSTAPPPFVPHPSSPSSRSSRPYAAAVARSAPPAYARCRGPRRSLNRRRVPTRFRPSLGCLLCETEFPSCLATWSLHVYARPFTRSAPDGQRRVCPWLAGAGAAVIRLFSSQGPFLLSSLLSLGRRAC